MRDIKQIIVHCSATFAHMDIGVAEIKKWHMDPPRNWRDIGYHYVIKRDGEVETGRPVDVVGAHCYGQNLDSIGICLVGGLGKDKKPESNFTLAQYNALAKLIDILKTKHEDIEKVHGHHTYNVMKACPVFEVNHLLSERG